MRKPKSFMIAPSILTAIFVAATGASVAGADKDLVPPQLPKDQQANLLRFLEKNGKPDRYFPRDARIVGAQPSNIEPANNSAPEKLIKQYTVQIVSHRPVPDQPEPKRVDVYYYRPNPEQGKPGITVRHTVDLTTGEQVGQTEVLVNHHTPMSREEISEAVDLAREKNPVLQQLYKDQAKTMVQYEYLQLMINRKHAPHEPGDRVIRLVFTWTAPKDDPAPAPIKVIVNLTKGVVVNDAA